ncbi:MAG: peptidoglycan-associated lipoprotein Pal [Desulfobulbaceae bacterium]
MRKHVGPFVVLVLFVSAMFLMTSCAQKKVTKAEQVIQPEPEAQEVVPDTSKEDAELAARLLEERRLREEAAKQKIVKEEFKDENIYFAFDSSDLSDQARLILNNNAKYLRKHSSLTATVEGHCDDRGSEEYNTALGKRRAESVKKFLIDQGISTDRLVTVSYGEKKPIALGHDEASWAKNRRAQTVVNLNSDYHKSAKN